MKKATFLIRFLIWMGLIGLTAAIWARPSRPSDRTCTILAGPSVIRNRVYRTDGANSVRLDVYMPRPIFRPVGEHASTSRGARHSRRKLGRRIEVVIRSSARAVGKGGIRRLRGRLPTRPARCSELARGA